MFVIEETARSATVVERTERPADDGATGGERRSRRSRPNRRSAAVLVVAGAVVVAIASLLLANRLTPGPREAGAGTGPPVPAPASSDLAEVTIQTSTYEPDQSSGWHSHSGIHAVLVVSGTLTIYEGDCQPRLYGPGDTYVGGRDVHLARNETATPVEMEVTYRFPAGASPTTSHVPAPAGCPLASTTP